MITSRQLSYRPGYEDAYGIVTEHRPCSTFREWRTSRNLTLNTLIACVGNTVAKLNGYQDPITAARTGLSLGGADACRISQWENGTRLPTANSVIMLSLVATLYDARAWAIVDLFPEPLIDWEYFFNRLPAAYAEWDFWARDIEVPINYYLLRDRLNLTDRGSGRNA